MGAIFTSGERPRPGTFVYLAGTRRAARDAWTTLKTQLDANLVDKYEHTSMVCKFVNGSRLYFVSLYDGEINQLRGLNVLDHEPDPDLLHEDLQHLYRQACVHLALPRRM